MDRKRKIELNTIQVIWCVLVLTSIFFPVLFILSFVPIIILTALLFVKNIRYNLPVFFVIMIIMCVISRGDLIYVVFTLLITLGVLGVLWGLKWQAYRLGAALSALIMFAAVIIPFVFYCPLNNKNSSDLIADYIVENTVGDKVILASDSQLYIVAKVIYRFFSVDGSGLSKSENPPDKEKVVEFFSEQAWRWGDEDIFYDLMNFSAAAGILSYLVVFFANNNSKELKQKSFHPFIVSTAYVPLKDMRLNIKYFLYVFFPALLFAFLGYIDSLKNASGAIFNMLVTVPSGFAAFTLLYHTVARTNKKLRIVLSSLLWIIAAVCLLVPTGMFVVSFVGLGDSLVNFRRLIDFALDQGEFEKKKKTLNKPDVTAEEKSDLDSGNGNGEDIKNNIDKK